MATDTRTRRTAATSVAVVLAALAAAPALFTTTAAPDPQPTALDADEIGLMGNAGHVRDSANPKVTAYFRRESYGPGDVAQLVVADTAPAAALQIFRAGAETADSRPDDVMFGAAVTQPVALGTVAGRRTIGVQIGSSWRSGVYFAQLTAPGNRVGYAPFILRPKRLGEHRVAVVMPTQTWQAYNFRDDDGDGHPDTWYAGWKKHTARLVRPFLNRGVPPHWQQYDAPFVRWLATTGRDVDYLSDAELRRVRDGKTLAGAYALIVFSGHHEYVTAHEYDAVQQYRDLGGNLAFLSANNFFWKITIAHDVMTRVAQWRDLGRPEAGLIGVQYRANDEGEHQSPWIVQPASTTTPWLFANLGAAVGEGISKGGIEIDATTDASPKSVRVVAEIPDLYGPGFTAQMTYYETRAGARVFAAGAFSLAASSRTPDVDRLLSNLWERLAS